MEPDTRKAGPDFCVLSSGYILSFRQEFIKGWWEKFKNIFGDEKDGRPRRSLECMVFDGQKLDGELLLWRWVEDAEGFY